MNLHSGEAGMFKTPPGLNPKAHGISHGVAAEFIDAWTDLAAELYATGKASGFYDTPADDRRFNHEQKLLLIVSEICEGVEGMRGAEWPGIKDDKIPTRPMIEVELADAVIRIMNYASHTGLDVAGAIIEKAAFNKTRGHRHGGKRF
jgi:NTP pyrophosphatase (non-canonical NTP hydrolase)